MTIATGQNINASDFINTSAGAGDASKGVKLDSAGKINPNMAKKFGCRLHSSSTNVSNGGMSTMSFPSESFDDDTMHENVTNPSRITIKTAGYWMIGGSISLAGSTSSAVVGIDLYLNNATVIAAGGGTYWGNGGGVTTIRHFAVNDYIQLRGISPSASFNASGDDATNFWAILLQKD
jgi:hypothetical protein